MVKYLLVAFSFLTIVSCSTETYEEYLVETNENLFPKGYFSYQYFDIDAYDDDSVLISFDDKNRPIEKTVKLSNFQIKTEKVKYTSDSEYEILQNNVVVETGRYQLKTFFKDKIIQKISSEKNDGTITNYSYINLNGDVVIDSIFSRKGNLVENNKFYWKRNANYPHMTNLDSIEVYNYIEKKFDKNDRTRRVIVFSDYISHQNPFIKLSVFEDTFYRSLSFSLYKKITQKSYDKDNKLIDVTMNIKDFYFKKGKVDLTK